MTIGAAEVLCGVTISLEVAMQEMTARTRRAFALYMEMPDGTPDFRGAVDLVLDKTGAVQTVKIITFTQPAAEEAETP